MIARFRRARTARKNAESGITLVELLVSVVLLTMVTGALSSAFVTAFRGARPTQERIRESNTAQNIAAFLVRDAQSAGGTDIGTGLADTSLGVSLSDPAGCSGGTGALVVRFKWIERGPGAKTHVAVYTYDSTTRELDRTECVDAASASALPLGRNISNSPTPIAACENAATSPIACNPALPDFVTLSITMANTAASSTSPYSYVLRASTRPDAPSTVSTTNTNVPVLVLGGGCPSSGGINYTGIDVSLGSPSVTVYGQAIVNNSCPAVDVGGSGSYTATGGTIVTPPGTCTGVPGNCTVVNTPITDPYASLTPPAVDCTGGTHPTNSGNTYYPGTYLTALSVNNATFQPGIYIFCNGLTVDGTTNASGAMFYFNGGTLHLSNGTNFTITPPATGIYGVGQANLAIWQRAGNNATMQMCCSNTSNLTVNGTVYAPTAIVDIKNGLTKIQRIIALGLEFPNGNGDTFFNPQSPALSMTTTTLPAWTVNRPYNPYTLAAAGGGAGYVWSVTNLPPGLSINPLTGVLSGTPTTIGGYSVVAKVTDSLGVSVTRTMTLTINNTPSITLPASMVDWTVNRAYNNTAITGTLGTAPYAWSVTGLPAGMSINATTGVITGTPTATGSFTPTVTLTDAAGATATRGYSFTINAAPSITGPATLPNWTANANGYSQTMTRANGTTPFVWSASGLPNGLTINPSTGVIGTTPTFPGTFNVTVSLTDAAGAVATRNYTVTINPAPGIATGSLDPGEQNRPYSFTMTPLAGAGTPPFTWSATNLHTGLLMSSGGVISGTPTQTGTRNITVTITDFVGASTNKVLSLTINTPVTITGPVSIQNWTVGRNYPNTQVTATAGVTPYTWSSIGLPSGMSINPTTGVITGTPTSTGTFNPVITVTSALGGTDTQSYTFTINAAPTVNQNSLPQGTRTRPYSTTLTASNGTGAKTWSATGLPPGLNIVAATGVISGTPSTIGSFDVTLTATDTAGASGTKILTIVINQTPAITSTAGALPDWTVGIAYPSVTIDAAGGTAPYTWSQSQLPTGLTLNTSSGLVTGTPTTAQTRTVVFTVTDANGATATLTDTVQIFAAPSVNGPASLPNGTVNIAYTNTTVTGTGGRAPYGWSATGLPAGMTMNPTTGVIGGTPTASGSFSVDVTLTDQSGAAATRNYTLAIGAATPSIVTSSLAAGELTISYNASLSGVGGVTPYTWSATGLPAGLSMSTGGVISGTPTAVGTSTVNVTLTDSASQTDSRSFSLVVRPHITITPTTCVVRAGNTMNGFNLTATGGTGPYTWSVSGLGWVSITGGGQLNGTAPSAGTYTATVTATDSGGNPGSITFTFDVRGNNSGSPKC